MEEAFVSAIYAAPDDDTPRLIFSDWLEENGQADRAELIRLQCKTEGGGPFTNEEDDRLDVLEEQHGAAWTRTLPQHKYVRWAFRRGFPEELFIELTLLLENYPIWSNIHHVRYLNLEGTTAGWLTAFAQRTWNPEWMSLSLGIEPKPWLHPSEDYDMSSGLRALVALPQAAQLRELHLESCQMSDEGILALSSSPYLHGLRVLEVSPPYANDPRLRKTFGNRLRKAIW